MLERSVLFRISRQKITLFAILRRLSICFSANAVSYHRSKCVAFIRRWTYMTYFTLYAKHHAPSTES